MKRFLLSVGVLASVLLAANLAFGQTNPSFGSAPKQQKVVLVKKLEGPKAVQEFESNVQVIQRERDAVVSLKTEMEKEKDAGKKKAMQTKLDEMMKKLTEDNDKMIAAYGFSLTRVYTMEIQSANIYMAVSDEEAAKIEAAQKAKAQEKK